MSGDLKKLYGQIIRSHNETPFHFEKMENASNVIKAYNPICGDRFEIFVDFNSKKISKIHFYGFGCAISKASSSVMTKTLGGKTLSESMAICNDFLNFMDRRLPTDELNLHAEFLAFSGVHDFPERYDCATLSWKEMRKFLESMELK